MASLRDPGELLQDRLQTGSLPAGPAARRLTNAQQLPIGCLELVVDDQIIVTAALFDLATGQIQPADNVLGSVRASLFEALLESRPAGRQDEHEDGLRDHAPDVESPLSVDVEKN